MPEKLEHIKVFYKDKTVKAEYFISQEEKTCLEKMYNKRLADIDILNVPTYIRNRKSINIK